MKNIYYSSLGSRLLLGDTLELLKELPKKSVDMIFADPPYFLSDGGFSNSGGKFVSVDKGDWDKSLSLKDKYLFNKTWIKLCKDILKDEGTIWITGSFHNIYSIGVVLEELDFRILNNITWKKLNPPPNLIHKYFTHSTETILWSAKKGCKHKYYFDYDLMKKLNNNKQMSDVWCGPLTPKREKFFGKHPTQKPEYLLERIILSSTRPNDIILDPFVGSGTTGVVARRYHRRFIGIDKSAEFLDITIKRMENNL